MPHEDVSRSEFDDVCYRLRELERDVERMERRLEERIDSLKTEIEALREEVS